MTTLSLALTEALQRRYPSVSISSGAGFIPMLDLDKGEISSTAAIEVARTLRGDALRIAREIVSDLATQVPGTWNIVSGYMILSDTPSHILREETRLRDELFTPGRQTQNPRTIVCLVPDATTPVYARLRLIACCALQALLAVAFEGGCRLGFEPESPRIVSTQDEVIAAVVEAVRRCFRNEREVRLSCEAPQEIHDREMPMTVWTSHHYHDRLSREAKRAFVESRNAGTSFLKIPADGWLLSRDRALSELLSSASLEKVIGRLSSRESWLRWVHHMASSIPSGDLDPAVSLYDECASPRWSLQVLSQRVAQLVTPLTPNDERELLERVVSLPARDRGLSLRALFIPTLAARAVREGEVLAWSAVVEQFAARAHATLNAPHYRATLKNGDPAGELMQINAGLVLGIVGILPTITEG